MKRLEPHYSGERSKAFWKRIGEVKDKRAATLLYLASCALQDHENRVLQMFDSLRVLEPDK